MSETPTLDSLKQTYQHLAFIHNKFLTTQFYLEEMKQADSVMKFITELANKIAQQIEELTPKEESQSEVVSE